MNKKLVKLISIVIIIIFIASYMIAESGYYEYTMQRRTIITNEKIKKFEEDIKNNKDVSTHDYIVEDYIDYTNAFSNLGVKVGDFTEKAIKYFIKKALKLISDLFYE